jgi:hypothetical protein
MLYFIITFFTGVITGALIEAAACKAIESKKPKENPAFEDNPPIFTTKSKPNQITLKTAISRDRFDPDHPEAVLDLVKTRLARQLSEIIETQIKTETDYINNCYIFKLSLWLREASNDD